VKEAGERALPGMTRERQEIRCGWQVCELCLAAANGDAVRTVGVGGVGWGGKEG
jgi:hypothetical protein